MLGWYLITTKLKSEHRVKLNLERTHGITCFFPTYPAKKSNSPVGMPLFARYVFVHCDMEHSKHKVQFAPGVSRVVTFGDRFIPIPDAVIDCLKARCDANDVLCDDPELVSGTRVRVKRGIFEGCEGIIREKRGNRRIQLLLELAYGKLVKIEIDPGDLEHSASR
ncbi:NGN domain-containing protein [Acanthopleuribacter pedis]